MGDFTIIAKQFTDFYYNTFDQNREELAPLYRAQSMLTFEDSAVQGVSGIIEKLKGLPFQKVKHQVRTLDAQPSNESGGILVTVTGDLLNADRRGRVKVDEGQRPLNYSQAFQLLPDGAGSYFVFNDIFRLIYGVE